MAYDEIRRIFTDRGLMQTLGEEIAKGMAKGGNSSAFSSFNPTGETAGRAGGRGDSRGTDFKAQREAQLDEIRARQAHSKYTNQLTKSFKTLQRELKSGEKDMASASRRAVAFAHVFEESWGKAMQKVSESRRSENKLVKNLNALLDEEIGSIEDVLKVRQKQQYYEKMILEQGNKVAQHVLDEHQRLSEALSDSTHGLTSFKDTLLDTGKSTVRAFFSVEAALVSLSFAAKQLYTDYQAQMKFGSEFTLWGQQFEALRSGVDPGIMAELMANTRQAAIAYGDANAYMDAIRGQQWKYYNQIGDLTETMKFTQDTFFLLGKSGIKPSAEGMDSLATTFRVLNKIAGVTSDQFTQMMEATLADEDITTRLRVAKQGERQAILQGIAKQIELNVAMGLTAEQAQAAALAMGKIAGGGARERFKRAAQMQMAFGAMGIEGGAEAADLVRKGRQRLTPGETARLEELTTRLTEASTAAMGGSIPGELVRDTILGKTGLDAYFGETSPLNKQLAEGLAGNKDVLKEIYDGIQTTPEFHQKAMMLWDKIYMGITQSGVAKTGAGLLQLGGSFLMDTAAFAVAGKMLGLGKGGGMMSGLGSMLGKGGAVRAAGMTGLRALPVLGGVAMAGKDLYDLSQGDTSGANTGALIGTGLGAAVGGVLGSIVPGAGTVVGAGLGAAAGNWLGETVGGLFDDNPMAEQQERLTSSTSELVDPTKRTAMGVEHMAELLAKNNELAEVRIQQNAGMLSAQETKARLDALRASGQIQYGYD